VLACATLVHFPTSPDAAGVIMKAKIASDKNPTIFIAAECSQE